MEQQEREWREQQGQLSTVEAQKSEEMQEILQQYEVSSHQLRLVHIELEDQREEKERIIRELEQLREQHHRLEIEYNEWMELIEQDQN